MSYIATASYSVGAALFLFLTVLLLPGWQGRMQGGLLILATAGSTVWAAMSAYYALPTVALPFAWLQLVEVLRNLAWLAFLVKVLSPPDPSWRKRPGLLRLVSAAIFGLCVALVILIFLYPQMAKGDAAFEQGVNLVILGHLLLAVIGLVLVEQVFRNVQPDQRWAIKFLCFGIGGLFAYDFYLYADGLLFKRIDVDLWTARGVANALAVPLIALSAARNREWSTSIFVSRHVIFHSATLVGAGLYLALMAAAGYYIRAYGGSWGPLLQVGFLSGALAVLVILLFSGQLRAQLKVFLAKHFYQNKYDYREEWLRFTHVLAEVRATEDFRQRVLQAIGTMVGAQAGVMWLKTSQGASYRPVAQWNMAAPEHAQASSEDSLVRFLQQRQWVVDLKEYQREPDRYGELVLPAWLADMPGAWLVVPLFQQEVLLGFVTLGRSRVSIGFNWEDSDLLKTAGRQAAGYLALMDLTEALSEARQFEAFNRLSAYVVHDLKNLVAQLSLVVSNAKKHMHNPEFVTDAIHTVENAVAKMNRLLAQLRKDQGQGHAQRRVELEGTLAEVVRARSAERPAPVLESPGEEMMTVADPDRLSAILGHVIQNAQEATPADGEVKVRLCRDANWVIVEVEDTGCGMEDEFIRERLFRPFDTTKGNAGMGVGAYEAREFVRTQGGEIEVTSTPGEGSRFRIRLPAYQDAARAVDQRRSVGALP